MPDNKDDEQGKRRRAVSSDYFRRPFLDSYLESKISELEQKIAKLVAENRELQGELELLKGEVQHYKDMVEQWKTQAEAWKRRYNEVSEIRQFDQPRPSPMRYPAQDTYDSYRAQSAPARYASRPQTYPSQKGMYDDILERVRDLLKSAGSAGMLQSELQKILRSYDRRRVGEVITEAVEDGHLEKEKEGRTFRIWIKGGSEAPREEENPDLPSLPSFDF